MASVDLANQRFLDQKLEHLEQLRGHMYNIVDDYVNTVMSSAKQWRENKAVRSQYYELLERIDRAAEFLDGKSNDILESAKWSLQSGAENDGPGQDSVSRKSEQLSAQETDDRILSEILQLMKTQEKRIEEHEEQMKKMTRIVFQVQNVASTEINKKFKTQEKRLDTAEVQVKNITSQLDQVQKIESELKSLKKQFKKLSESQDIFQDQIRSEINESLERKLTALSNESDSLKDFMVTSQYKNKSFLETLAARTDSLEQVTAILSDRITDNKDMIGTITIKGDKQEEVVQEMEKRLALAEIGDMKCHEDLQTQFEGVKTNYQMVCQMLANRLQPLEQLRQILNDRSRARDENVTKLIKVVKEVAAMSPKIADLELKSSRGFIGFCAVASEVQNVAQNCIIKPYSVYCNEGSHFDPLSGGFTVPKDGIYFVNITTVCRDRSNILDVCVLWKRNDFGNIRNIHIFSDPNGIDMPHSCDLGLVKLGAGNILFAKVIDHGVKTSTYKTVRFICFLID